MLAAGVGLATAGTARAQLTVGAPVNASQLAGGQAEAAIAVNPSNPLQLFVVSNTDVGGGLFAAYSTDGGATWTDTDPSDGTIADGDATPPLVAGCCDGSVSWDDQGNLFFSYLAFPGPVVIVALSTDGGVTFSQIATLGASADQETIVAAENSVWLTWNEGGSIVASGASVTGLGLVGAFSAPQTAPGSAGLSFGDISIGPGGQVLVSYGPSGGETGGTIFVNLDADGLGAGGFAAAVAATTTNVGGFDFIGPQSGRSIDSESGLAYDRTGGVHDGRVYLVYTDESPNESDDTDVFVRFSDDDGATWSAPVRANDDATVRSQFLPRIALDQTTGNIGVCFHDARNDDGLGGAGDTDAVANTDAQFFCTASTDAGATFATNVQVSTGTSNAAAAGSSTDYGDYSALDFTAGVMHPAFADNSNSTGDNPDGALSRLDIYTAAVTVAAVCGNGLVEGGETCDDGNALDGDCCSSTCQLQDCTLEVAKDAFLRKQPYNTNEGANGTLTVRNRKNRTLVGFDLTGKNVTAINAARLVFTVKRNRRGWGRTGKEIDAHALLEDFAEGNGQLLGSRTPTRGTGAGVTSECAVDADIANVRTDCASTWDGGNFTAAPSDSVTHTNSTSGTVSFDVTTDVQAGVEEWLLKRAVEHGAGAVDYYSREGAALAGDPTLAPRLVLDY